MLVLKPGVRLTDMCAQMVFASVVVDQVMSAIMGPYYACVITSVNDGVHSANSWHYKGRAGDYRTKTYTGDKTELRDEVKRRLGADFDVVMEKEGEDNEHLHVEYDPKQET